MTKINDDDDAKISSTMLPFAWHFETATNSIDHFRLPLVTLTTKTSRNCLPSLIYSLSNGGRKLTRTRWS